jgi:N-methylhydantoinase A
LRDTVTGEMTDWAIYDRTSLSPGARLPGPAVIAEDETSTLVGPGWSASINRLGYIELLRGVA